jgi:hypothetical protein
MADQFRLPLGAEVEARIFEVDAEPPAVEIGLWRCSPNDQSREFHRTAAALRIPLHLLPLLIEALQRIRQRAEKQRQRSTEHSLWAPPAGDK